jgi:dihydropteroate synthase
VAGSNHAARAPAWVLHLPGGRVLEAGNRPLVVGVINCTPDSFSDAGLHATPEAAIAAGIRMLGEGADWLDVGGESTRPGSQPVPREEQERRILPVIRGLRARSTAPISADTRSPEVGRAALAAGADIVNDVAGLRDPGWAEVLLAHPDVPVVVGHMQGTPRDMQDNPNYPDGATPAVLAFFRERLATLAGWGLRPDRVILDPGLGFGKRLQDNLELIRSIDVFRSLGRPVFIGASRKGFIDKVMRGGADLDRDLGTVMMNAAAICRGADMLRVHNVAHASALVRVFMAVRDGHA